MTSEIDAIAIAKSAYEKSEGRSLASNIRVACTGHDENGYTIHAYEDMETHTATLFWYTVREDGTVWDEVFCKEVE